MARFRRRSRAEAPGESPLEREVGILRQMLQHYPDGQRPTFGGPTRCPSCGNFGFVELVDQAQGASVNECFSCGARWMVTRRALRRLSEELASMGRVEVHEAPRSGILLDMEHRLAAPSLLDADVAPPELLPQIVPLVIDGSPAVPVESEAPRSELPSPPAPARPGLEVLLVEDSDLDAELIQAILAPLVPSQMTLTHATSSQAGKALLDTRSMDLVLLDLGLPDSHGMETLRNWRGTGVPFAVVSGDSDLALASAAKRAGAAEFVPKRRLAHYIDGGASGTDELAEIIRRTALTRT